MAPGGDKRELDAKTKHTVVMSDALWLKLRVAALEERQDVSEILSRLADDWLKSRKKGGR
jgi:hypothetical protein